MASKQMLTGGIFGRTRKKLESKITAAIQPDGMAQQQTVKQSERMRSVLTPDQTPTALGSINKQKTTLGG